jgi:hypothetical protein
MLMLLIEFMYVTFYKRINEAILCIGRLILLKHQVFSYIIYKICSSMQVQIK